MQLVVLAAGYGTRFGGLKQLAPVGPRGEALMDYTAHAAYACGYDGVVVVVRDEILDEIRDHVRTTWPADLDVEYALQPPVRGTAQALYCTRDLVSGTFGVANADDLYGTSAIAELLANFNVADGGAGDVGAANDHVLIAYQLLRTVLTSGPVTRGLVDIDTDARLAGVVEHTVSLRPDGFFDARALPSNEPNVKAEVATRLLSGTERVSMNLFGFHQRMFDELAEALDRFDPELAGRPDLLLPDVVGHLVKTGSDVVRVVDTDARCIGITYLDDLTIVRDELALAPPVASFERTLES